MIRNTFRKSERLTNKKAFEQLFSKGKSIVNSPFRLVWQKAPSSQSGPEANFKLGISVPKRSFSKAVQRNKLKRRIREAFRKNKHGLYEVLKKNDLTLEAMVIYTSREELPYKEIEGKMIVSLQKLIAALQ
jgi:ribonuclease P protein component